jgi:hypothetical protein
VTRSLAPGITGQDRVEGALLRAGLVRRPDGALARPGGAGTALRALAPSGGWSRHVSLPREAGSDAAQELAPPGPFKTLPGPEDGSLVLAADIPSFIDEIPDAPGAGPGGPKDGPEDDPVFAPWAEALVDALGEWDGEAGASRSAPPPLDPALLVERLRALGWDASAASGAAAVNLPARRSFHQARFIDCGGRGVLIEAELAAQEAPDERWHEAAIAVARAANEGLRLVRVAVRRVAGRASIAAQVHLGRLPLAAQWLPLSLAAVAAAVSLLGREARALADPAVADLVVSSLVSRLSRTTSGNGGGKEFS